MSKEEQKEVGWKRLDRLGGKSVLFARRHRRRRRPTTVGSANEEKKNGEGKVFPPLAYNWDGIQHRLLLIGLVIRLTFGLINRFKVRF